MSDFNVVTDEEFAIIQRSRKEKQHEEYQYLHLVEDVIRSGYTQNDRTGVGTLTKIGAQMKFSLRNNTIPVYTTRRTFFRGAVEELLWILRGETDITCLQDKNIHIWDGNTTEGFIKNRGLDGIVPPNSVGTLYGFQFRNWNGDWEMWRDNKIRTGVDQLLKIVTLMKNDPNSRRILSSNYNVSQTETGVLEPCHTLYSFNIDSEKKEIHSLLWMRSCDLLCGNPLNILHISLLTHILAKMLGYTAGDFIFQSSNTHVYKNHIKDAMEQINRTPYKFPTIQIKKDIKTIKDIESLTYEDFDLKDYVCHPPIKYEMAI
jgi:dihydrofolate reductase/thymidylate synthase